MAGGKAIREMIFMQSQSSPRILPMNYKSGMILLHLKQKVWWSDLIQPVTGRLAITMFRARHGIHCTSADMDSTASGSSASVFSLWHWLAAGALGRWKSSHRPLETPGSFIVHHTPGKLKRSIFGEFLGELFKGKDASLLSDDFFFKVLQREGEGRREEGVKTRQILIRLH